MGIAFSNYFLNIRPFIFKQKRIIISSLLLIAINIGFMFIILYLSNTYHMPELLERNLDDDIYTGYVYENKAENTKQMLTEKTGVRK